ncbi:hypothetical protein [Streptomyces sp. NPDC051561]|uniref:hypothetical protein n=1 Tax=Streptomyces sp. NPDC051561 TaxID=3365658 RepID=UPI00379B36CC
MGIVLGLICVIAAAGLFWATRWIGGKGLRLLGAARAALRGSAATTGTCVSPGSSRHLYRFTTPDGVSHDVYVPRTSESDQRKAGSTSRLRYRIDDPKTVSNAALDEWARPLGAAAVLFLAACCAASAVLLLFLGVLAVVGS